MKTKGDASIVVLLALATAGLFFLFTSLWLAPVAKAASPPRQTPSPQTFVVTDTLANSWHKLLARTPLPFTAPLSDPAPSPLDGTYAKLDPAWPQWWICRRCADYRPSGGIWKLQFAQGVMRVYYDITGWSSLASFSVSGDRLTLFNDPYCPEERSEYTWSLRDGQLQLEAVKDACAFGLRERTLSQQVWPACASSDTATEANDLPGCAESPIIPAAPAVSASAVTVNVYGGESRFFGTPPDVLVFANSPLRAKRAKVDLTFHADSIPFGLNRVLWWDGDWIEVTTNRPFTAMGVQFMGDPYMGWARVLFDGAEVWRGNTAAIWTKHGRHGGYIEISGFSPGQHTLRAESLIFDYHPIQVASFGFSEANHVEPVKPEPITVVTDISAVDGATLVFVPAGQFLMGSPATDREADPDEQPVYHPNLAAYWIDQTEVTNTKYRQCVEAGGCTAPMHSTPYSKPEYAEHPILGVTWFQADEYCRWAGRRLPSEAEWEKAARGPDGRLYPWGNNVPEANLLNFAKQVDDTTPVGSYPAGASPYGALDMAGNVWEWVADGYDANYYAQAPASNPTGGISANQRVIRGGDWGVDARAVRAANRFWAFPGRNDTDGFRCALTE